MGFQRRFKGFTRKIEGGSEKTFFRKFQGCLNKLQGSFKKIPKKVSRMF